MFLVNDVVDVSAARQGHLRAMTTADLESILKLRNHAEIRRYMLTHHEISLKEHLSWFDRASQDPSLELLVFEINKICCGFVQFKETNYSGVVDWGFYVTPDAPKGTGRKLGLSAINHAFKKKTCTRFAGKRCIGISHQLNSINCSASCKKGFCETSTTTAPLITT